MIVSRNQEGLRSIYVLDFKARMIDWTELRHIKRSPNPEL